MKTMTQLLVLTGLLAVLGCADQRPVETATSTTQPAAHAECLVCKYNADLACVDVPVEADTPRTVWNGKMYYFCSESCRRKFEKDPQKYARR